MQALSSATLKCTRGAGAGGGGGGCPEQQTCQLAPHERDGCSRAHLAAHCKKADRVPLASPEPMQAVCTHHQAPCMNTLTCRTSHSSTLSLLLNHCMATNPAGYRKQMHMSALTAQLIDSSWMAYVCLSHTAGSHTPQTRCTI